MINNISKKNKPQYIFISGGVISSLGKGVTSASLAFLLKRRGYKITPVKCENYLNIDSGLINPIEHGDPFLCSDGTEADLDLGTYEKFLNQNVGKANFITMGQIYKSVIEKERKFGYEGEDVEAIPHVTDEIIYRIKKAGEKEQADIVIIELGGTVGEYQNALYYEASRIMKFRGEAVIHIHVSYLPTPSHIGEPKTKPTQLSVKTLNSLGIQPDFIVARSEVNMDKRRRERFSLFCSVQPENIIDNPDLANVYELPLIFAKQQFDIKILKMLGLKIQKVNLADWEKMIIKYQKRKETDKTIVIVGKYFTTGDYKLKDSYAALLDALDHAQTYLEKKVNIRFINSEDIEKKGSDILKTADGIIVPIGWGKRGVEGKISAIKYARINKIPYLGLCYGMQLAVVEFARNVLGLESANSLEVNPFTKYPVIHINKIQEENKNIRAYGGTMRLGDWDCRLSKNSISFQIYEKWQKQLKITNRFPILAERHRHRYELNNIYREQLEEKGLKVAGESTAEPLVEIIEFPQKIHPFFIGVQYHPEYQSRPLSPHPLFLEFINQVTT